MLFARVWSGFAATIDAADLPEVQALGLRVEPVRRFYGAAARSRRCAGRQGEPGAAQPARRGAPAIALLDSGVEAGHPALSGRIAPGYDAVGRDRDPSPGRGPRGRREEHGTQVAGVLVDELPEGERILSVRVAGLQRAEETGGLAELGTTDQLMAGLECAVDPNRDGDAADRIPVALVGVSSPYSGFAETPEAEAAGAARSLGTLVIAPAGNEGAPAGRFGTIGSPGAAAGALAVGGARRERRGGPRRGARPRDRRAAARSWTARSSAAAASRSRRPRWRCAGRRRPIPATRGRALAPTSSTTSAPTAGRARRAASWSCR